MGKPYTNLVLRCMAPDRRGMPRDPPPGGPVAVVQLSGPEGHLTDNAVTAYASFVDALNLREPQNRGNGTMTVLAALTLAAAAPADPAGISRLAVGVVGTDTDTIATMAAALSGATDAAPDPPFARLRVPHRGSAPASEDRRRPGDNAFQLSRPPELDSPRAQLDAVGTTGDQTALAGLGWLTSVEGTKPITARGTEWVWMRSDFGATFLVKQRASLRVLPAVQWPVRREVLIDPAMRHASHDIPHDQLTLDDNMTMPSLRPSSPAATGPQSIRQSRVPPDESADNREQISIDDMITWVARRGNSPEAVGYATKRIAELGTSDQLIAFTTAIRAAIRNPRK